jgi:hypothetical protein
MPTMPDEEILALAIEVSRNYRWMRKVSMVKADRIRRIKLAEA